MTQQDACELLDTDHQAVEQLFTQYQATGLDQAAKSQLAESICMELTVHAAIEEEIFYPAFRRAVGDDELVDEAEDEHEEVRDLICQIEDGEEIEPLMAQLQEAVEHHVRQEREQMFPKARKSAGLDLVALGTELEKRKAELMAGNEAL